MTAAARVQAPPVGLYSIGVRGLDVEPLLRWAAAERIPFIHLRGGPRGCDVAAGWDSSRAERVRAVSQATVPITMVTAGPELSDLLPGGARRGAAARADLRRLAQTAALTGAGTVRLLATGVPDLAALETMELPRTALPVLIEPHASGWLQPAPMAALERLLARWPQSGLLLDTAQVQAAADGGDPATLVRVVERAAALARVLHISDPGSGLEGGGHCLAAEAAARALLGGARMEVAFEWTGSDRSAATCLERWRAAAAWWASVWGSAAEGGPSPDGYSRAAAEVQP